MREVSGWPLFFGLLLAALLMLAPVKKIPLIYLTLVSYAELGSAIPLNGGAYIYLRHTYGPMVGCLFSWTMIFILKPVPVAIVSLIFGDYINRILYFSLNSNETTPI